MFRRAAKKQAEQADAEFKPKVRVVGPGILCVDSADLIRSPKVRAQIRASRYLKTEKVHIERDEP